MAEKMWSSVVDAWSETYGNVFDGEGTYGMRCARPETKKRRIAERVLKNELRRTYGLYWRAGLKAYAKHANEYLIAHAQTAGNVALDAESSDADRKASAEQARALWPRSAGDRFREFPTQSAANVAAMASWKRDVNAMFRRVAFGLPGCKPRFQTWREKLRLKKRDDAPADPQTWQEQQEQLVVALDEAHEHAKQDKCLEDEAHYTDVTDEYTPLRPSARTASLLTEFSRLTLAEQSEFFASLGGLTGDAATREDMKRAANGVPGGGGTADKVSYQPLAAFHGENRVKVGLYGKEITAGIWADMVLFPGYTVFFKVRRCAV